MKTSLFCIILLYIKIKINNYLLIFYIFVNFEWWPTFHGMALFSDEPEVFLPKYSQTAILHAAHFRRVVNVRPAKAIRQ